MDKDTAHDGLSSAGSDSPNRASAAQAGKIAEVLAALSRLRAAARAALVIQRTAWIAALLLLAAALGGALDFVLRTPAPIRMCVWLAAMVLTAYWFRRLVVPAARFRPSLIDLALRVERQGATADTATPSGQATGPLSQGVGLALSPREPSGAPDAAIRDSLDRAALRLLDSGLTPPRIAGSLRLKSSFQAVGLFAGVCALCLIAAAASPQLFAIGITRTLAPWLDAPWPKRTQVVDVTALQAHPVGASLPIRAALTRTDRPPGRTDVWAVFRTRIDGQDGATRRVLLTGQARRVFVPSADSSENAFTADGELFERLIDPDTIARGGSASAEFEYWLETADDRTQPQTIALVEPPSVVSAQATVTPPAYAASAGERFSAGTHDLGPGTDERAQLRPILAGSSVELRVTLNKPVEGTPAMLGAEIADADLSLSGQEWTIRFDAKSSVRMPLAIADEYGITSVGEPVFTLDVQDDQPPTTTVANPAHDESVLARATIALQGEARDDVGVASLALRTRIAVAPQGSAGAPAEPQGDATQVAVADPATEADPRRVMVSAVLDLATLTLKPRDEVWISTLASDAFLLGDLRHDPVESPLRKLRIIEEGEFIDQVLAELSGVRQAAERLDEDQKRLMQAPADRVASPQNQRAQEQLGERTQPLSESLERTRQRLERNNLGDPSLAGIIRDAQSLAQAARERIADAQAAQQRAEAASDEKSIADVREAQQRVRDELSRLTDLLERGRDSYAARRALESILNDQRELATQSTAAGEETAGKQQSQLSPEEAATLRSLAERQRELSKRTDDALDDLARRAERLQESDPVQADALRSAAQRGRQSRTADEQRKAAQQLEENKTRLAQDAQDASIKALEEMIGELDQGQERRDQTLRRLLADVMEELERLAAEQETQIQQLAGAVDTAALTRLADPLIKLNQDTIGLSSKIRSGFKELEPINEPLLAAAKAQGTAAAALRATAPDAPKADANQRISLARLNEALELARKAQEQSQQRESERKRQELLNAYRQALEQQVILKEQAAPLAGRELSRRERMAAREISERQEALRAQVAQVREQAEGIAESGLFELAHRRYDDTAKAAAESLASSIADQSVTRRQESAVRLLRSLAEALTQPPQKEKDFREAEAGGGGGGGAGQEQDEGLIPPIAELRMLRFVQEELALRTREQGDRENGADPAELSELGVLQQEIFTQGNALIEKLKEQAGEEPDEAPGGGAS